MINEFVILVYLVFKVVPYDILQGFAFGFSATVGLI